ncbi:hypothetical protein B0T26DRAFT_645974 [Lasiosphaeria miniovina]|uniref:Extracellular membrane protein CFEM domain-containing protein n=1 Tax=Lasiosphaeria miniovina TaxID=1954250 RepID=A0AA40ALH8_9PEZI|nr:uncharacterized protein B0T26DRAFT_645974 [Lasiosphaeria miniovina]KAK0718060.1 hypothetical protein B0T26DRAFT_645974 [Lasiosphaeria miniovina]
MRSTTPLALLLAARGTYAVEQPQHHSRPECVQARSAELADAAACGDRGSLNYCFSSLSQTLTPRGVALVPAVERCFVAAGCTGAEAAIEAQWVVRVCDDSDKTSPSQVEADLRRRRSAARAAAAGMPVLREAGLPTLLAARQAAAGPTTAAPAIANNSPTGSPSPCSTETVIDTTSCPVQSTGDGAGKKLACFPAKATMQVCREGLICQFDKAGAGSCMYKQTSLGLAGIIIAIIFAVAVAASVFGVCFLCCKERRVQKRLERAADEARIVKEAKTSAMVARKKSFGAGGSAEAAAAAEDGLDRQPLMAAASDLPPLPPMPQQYTDDAGYQSQSRSQKQQQYAQQQDFGGSENPFADSRDAHPLR